MRNDTYKERIFLYVSPLCAVWMTWLTETFLSGIFENQPSLPIINSRGTGGHAVRTISQIGTSNTVIGPLKDVEINSLIKTLHTGSKDTIEAEE